MADLTDGSAQPDPAESDPAEQDPPQTAPGGASAPAVVASERPAPPPAEPEFDAAPETAPRIVYVQAPVPPADHGNRGFGILLALLGAVVFAVVYAIAAFLLMVMLPPATRGMGAPAASALGSFVASPTFWLPVLFFTLGFVLLVLVVNRGGWWLYVLFGHLVALFTLFASVGALLLIDRVLFLMPSQAAAAYWGHLLDPRLIAAAGIAREVVIWAGLAIAARGRHVKVRNAERRAAFEAELAEKRAEHERTAAVA